MKKKILISTGGSGGHVVPALNLYNHLKNEFDVMLYTDLRGAKYVPEKIKKTIFEVKKIPEKKYLLPLKIIFLFFAFIKSLIHFKGNKIDILISTGGYMSLPIVLAAKIFNTKIILFELDGIIISLNIYFKASDKDCNKPNGPTTLGPFLFWTNAQTRLSNQTINATDTNTTAKPPNAV